MSSHSFSVRAYQPGDEHALAEMIGNVFGGAWSQERWRWHFQHTPEGPALIHVLEHGDRVVGHIAHHSTPVFVEGRRLCMGRGGTTMVHPEFQGRGGMRHLLEAFLASDHGFAMRMNFPNDKASALMPRYGGGRHLGRFPRWIRWHGDSPRLRGTKRLLVRSGAMRGYSALVSWPRPAVAVEPLRELGTEIDELARESAAFAPCIRVRDAAYLRWRWQEQPGREFMLRAARGRDGSLRGFVVFMADRMTPPNGRIVDVLARDPDALRALLMHATDALTALGCVRVILDYADPRPWARWAVIRSGFLRAEAGMNVTGRALSPQAGAVVERLEAWYLTCGDSERL